MPQTTRASATPPPRAECVTGLRTLSTMPFLARAKSHKFAVKEFKNMVITHSALVHISKNHRIGSKNSY